LIESQDILDNIGSIALAGPNILAMLTAFVSGIFAIRIFINLLNRGKFSYIAFYCWIMGALTVLFSMASVV
jgi:undecaprenyl-diphosphatase